MRSETSWEHDELPDGTDYRGKKLRCRDPYCANNTHSRTYEAVTGILCDACERAAEREDEENPRCAVCEIRRDDHGEPFPCALDDQDEPFPCAPV